MKTIIYFLLAVFIIGMLPLDITNANPNVRIVIEAKKSISEADLKRSSDIISHRLNDAGITAFDIDIEPGRIIVKMPAEYATDPMKDLMVAKGRFEFRDQDAKHVIFDGSNIESINALSDPNGNPYAEIRFIREAIPVWAEATRKNLNKPISIYVDNKLIYDPVVRNISSNGSCVITGNFKSEEILYLAILGNNGELPAEFAIVE